MDALRLLTVLLLSCALLAGASYVRRLDVFSAGPLSESAAPSRLSCAALCNRTSGCVGFTFTDGGQYVIPPPAAMDALRPSAVLLLSCALLAGASYVRRLDVFSAGPLAESAAPSLLSCAAWCNRTSGCVGFTFTDGGQCQLFDGILRKLVKPFNSFTCDTTRDGFVCESPSICSPCPYGWLTLDDYCYHYVSTAMAWQAADDHCAGLQPGARLSPVISMEIYTVLYHSLSLPSYIWVGLTDVEVDGTWKAVDGTESSFTWLPNEPNGGTGENCLEFNANGANDLTCTLSKPFVCRVRKDFCLE
ncbi:CD209 antigen-like protein C [Amphibalanus amphitrite]|nr:CD209 antigen-like protein C [Amphibalanus amphitrite]